MVSHGLLAGLLTLFALASCVHSAQLYHLHGSLDAAAARPTTPNTWTVTAVAPTTEPHTVTIAMHFHNLEYMQQHFNDIHDPTHPSWLNHLTREEIHTIIAPPQHSTDRLLDWMQRQQGVPAEHVEYLIGANAIRVESTIGHINRLFNTTMHEYTHTDGHTVYRQLGGSFVPDEFVPLIHIVDGLAMMPYAMKKHVRVMEFDAAMDSARTQSPAPASSSSSSSSSEEHRHSAAGGSASRGSPAQSEVGLGLPDCSGFVPIVPVNSMYGWYNISDQSSASVGSSPTTSTQTVQFFTLAGSKYQANSFSPSDLTSYSQMWSHSASGSALKVQTVTGPNDASNPTDEPSLDVQSITALNPVAANQFELTALRGQQYWWAAGFVSRTNVAQVVSISYGIDEAVFLLPRYGNQVQDGLRLADYLAATNNLVSMDTAHRAYCVLCFEFAWC